MHFHKSVYNISFGVVLAFVFMFLLDYGIVFARGHEDQYVVNINTKPKSELVHPDFVLKKIKSDLTGTLNFSKEYKTILYTKNQILDFNKDGVEDMVICNGSDYTVTVYNANKTKDILYRWNGPKLREQKLSDGRIMKRRYTGCQVISFGKRHKAIIISTSYEHPTFGFRVPATQFIIDITINKNGKLSGNVNIIRNPDGTYYFAAARSVKCTKYPKYLVDKGYNPGILCFFAGYDQTLLPTPNAPSRYGTKTALLKIERTKDGFVYKDLNRSGIPWFGGMKYGTDMNVFPSVYISGSSFPRSDGLHMMGGAWLDYDGNKLPDLITIGQHASIKLFSMYYNPYLPEGVGFRMQTLLQASPTTMTEFLTITSFSEHDPSIKVPCVYITGEGYKQNTQKPPSPQNTVDHIRCYRNGVWNAYKLPGKNGIYSSLYAGPVIKRNTQAKGSILILAPNFLSIKNGIVERNLFKLRWNTPVSYLLDMDMVSKYETRLASAYSILDSSNVKGLNDFLEKVNKLVISLHLNRD